jgi:cytochrome c oxidase subunit 3
VNNTEDLPAEKQSDYTSAKTGMWLFLFTEILLFSGMFLLYSAYRAKYPQDFHNASRELNTIIGTFNTIILLTSSLTMALSISAIQKGNKKWSTIFLILTILLGVAFLVNKYMEWSAKIHHGIYPDSSELLEYNKGEILFFGLYFAMTGLHGLHVIVGIVLLSVMLFFVLKRPYTEFSLERPRLEQFEGSRLAIYDEKGMTLWESDMVDDAVKKIIVTFKHFPIKEKINKEDFVVLENSGLYWHLIDIIWIFLFPLFYLIT